MRTIEEQRAFVEELKEEIEAARIDAPDQYSERRRLEAELEEARDNLADMEEAAGEAPQ